MKAEFGVSFDGGGPSWNTLPLGAGGFITGLAIASDGTMVIRTDVYGAYVGDVTAGTKWQQVCTFSAIPSTFLQSAEYLSGTVGAPVGVGVTDIVFDPSSSSNIWMNWLGCILKSTNKGASWTWCSGFTQVSANPQGIILPYRYQNGQTIAVDPNNSDIVYVGTPNAGVFYTTNGGTSWTQISTSTLPEGTADGSGYYPGTTGICFDPASGTTGGATNTIYVSIYGSGTYQTTNAGSTWSKLTSGTGPNGAVVTSAQVVSGAYYALAPATGLWKYSGGTWSAVLSDSVDNYWSFAVNPGNTSEIVVLRGSAGKAYLNATFNGGSSWTGVSYGTQEVTATDVPWLVSGALNVAQGAAFDPNVSGRIWIPTGVGVFYTDSITSGWNASETIDWVSQNAGIEELNCNDVIAPPGVSEPILGLWDANIMVSELGQSNPYPTTSNGYFNACWQLDWASNDSSFICGVCNETNGTPYIYVSSNGGSSWTAIASPFDTYGGAIAASTSENMIAAASWGADSVPVYTTNQWSSSAATNLPSSQWVGGYGNRAWRPFAADRVGANSFYAYDPGGTGVYASTNSGETFSKVSSFVTNNTEGFVNYALRCIANAADSASDLWVSDNAGASNSYLYYSTGVTGEGSISFTELANVANVVRFGFGKPKVSGHYPTLYLLGAYNGAFGLWIVDDVLTSPTWTNILPSGEYTGSGGGFVGYPNLPATCQLDSVVQIDGDWNHYPRVYVTLYQPGAAYYG